MASTKSYNKTYYEQNKAKLAAAKKAYYERNREKILKEIRAKRKAKPVDPETRRRWSLKYYRKHRKAIREKARAYYRRKAQERKDAKGILHQRKGSKPVRDSGARKGDRAKRPHDKKVGA